MARRSILVFLISALTIMVVADGLLAQGGPGRGPGRGRGRGQGPGGPGFRGRQDPTFAEDHAVFHYLLDHGNQVRRQVKNLKNGIETLTESDDPEIAGKIQEHVAAMYDRLEEKRPIHMRDPLFRELFQHADKIEMSLDHTDQGVRVVETSKDPYVAKLLQEHAKVVTLFIKHGRAEAHKNHPLPQGAGRVANEAAVAKPGCCQEKACCQTEGKAAGADAAAPKKKGCCGACRAGFQPGDKPAGEASGCAKCGPAPIIRE